MEKKKLFVNRYREQLVVSKTDRMYHFLLAGKSVRGAIVRAPRMILEMQANHELGILETLVLGHGYLAAGLLSALLKGRDRISMQIECSGPIKGLVVEANAFGEVRGYLRKVPIPIDEPLESFNISRFFGAGFLTVTKHLESAKKPFFGKTLLEYGSIAKDLANYFLTSEQIPTAFNLSIQFDDRGEVIGAGGLYLQAMPGADQNLMADLERRVFHLPSLGTYFAGNGDPKQLIVEEFQSLSPEFLGEHPIEFMCHCQRDRLLNTLLLLPDNDRKDIKENGPFPLEIRCHNCNTLYSFTKEDIEQII